MKFKGCGALLLFNLEGENSSTPNPGLVQHSFIREQPWFQTRGLLFWGPLMVLWLLMMLSKLQVSPRFQAGRPREESQIQICDLPWHFIYPDWDENFVPTKSKCFWFRKLGLCVFETLQENRLLKSTSEGDSQTKSEFTGNQKRISPTAYYPNNWEQFNTAGCLTRRSPLAVLWCLGNKSFHRTN